MKITTEPLQNRQLRLIIEVGEERTQQAMQHAAHQISKEANFPGFRRGKVPYDLILQRYGEDTLRKEAADILAQEVYGEALDQEGIEPYAPGMLEQVDLDPMTFEFTVPLRPAIDLGDYRRHRLKPPKVRITKKQVQEALERIREDNAVLELVERPVGLGDGVVMDFRGQTADGEQVFEGDGIRLLLEAESTLPAPGFAEAVVGMEAGHERTFTLTLADDYPREDLQGVEVEFIVKVMEVYDGTLPKLDDDLARTVGSFDSIKELKKHVKEQLQQAAQLEADEAYAQQVVDAIVERARVEYPPTMLERELDGAVKEVERTVQREAKLTLEDYLRLQGKSMEELRDELAPTAAERLERGLVLGEVVRLEELDVNEEEIAARIEAASAPWGVRSDDVRGALSSDTGQQAVRGRLLADKAVRRLVAIARGEAPQIGSTERQGANDAEEGEQ